MNYQSLFASQITYVLSVGFTKFSTSFFIAGFLTRNAKHVRMARTLTAICGVWTVAAIFTIAIRGKLTQPWDTRDGSDILVRALRANICYLTDTILKFTRWLAIEIAGFVIEIGAVGLAIHFVSSLQMPLKKRLSVSAIFGSRLL